MTGAVDTADIPTEHLAEVLGYKMDDHEVVIRKEVVVPELFFIILNTYKEPFNNVYVRQALAYATPYELIVETVYEGYLKINHGGIPMMFPGYTDYKIINYTAIPYEQRMEIAKKLIEKAGIDPSKYTIELWFNSGNPRREKVCTLLAESWNKLGFKVSVKGVEWAVLWDLTSTPEKFDGWTLSWFPDYLDPDNYAGPLFYGGTRFKEVHINIVQSPEEVSKYVKTAKVFDTRNYYVVVGEKGSGAKVNVSGKPFIVVSYVVDEEATKPIEESKAWVNINPAFYRNVTTDALIIAARWESNMDIRIPIYEAIYRATNYEMPCIWLGHYVTAPVEWDWLYGRYIHPTLAVRFDLLWESPDAPTVSTGIKDYVNDPSTYAIAPLYGWVRTFDPAFNYERFGWTILHNIGDTLVTYWKEETKELTPDLAVAWAHDESGTEWYFVIRGGVKAYDPWHDKLYDVTALDALFTIWRIGRLEGDPSWMITEFVDVNSSKVLTEEEFDQILKEKTITTYYRGQVKQVKSLKELLEFFGYDGPTAGVVMFKLYKPYTAFINILAVPFTTIIPAKYLFDNVDELKGKYEEAMEAAEWGKNPSAWAKYIGKGSQEPTHLYLHKYPIGTGPYYIKEYVEKSYLVLEYNPYYWNATLWEQLYGFKP